MDDTATRTDAVMAWFFADHVCRACFGRVMVHIHFDRRRTYRCTCCGLAAVGKSEAVMCACGIRLKNGRDAGVRCVVNTERSPENPAEIVARQADPVAAKRELEPA